MNRPKLSIDSNPTSADKPHALFDCWLESNWLYGTVTALATGYILMLLVPHQMFFHDEGQYAEGAVRILRGQLPHRDFHEMYTGALSYLHALAFSIAGSRMVVLRYTLVLFCMPVSIVAYDVFRQLTGVAWIAAALAVSLFVMSIGMTHSAWANSYLMLCGILVAGALMRDANSASLGWIFLAGLACGLAVTIKVTGLYLIAATGLAITFRGHPIRVHSAVAQIDRNATKLMHVNCLCSRLWRIAVALLAVAFAVTLVRKHISLDVAAYFLLPIASVAVTLVLAGNDSTLGLVWRYACFVAGVGVPIAILLIPWWMGGALDDLWYGLFELPKLRLSTAFYPPPPLFGIVAAIASIVCFLPLSQTRRKALAWMGVGFLSVLLFVGLLDAPTSSFSSQKISFAMAAWRWLPTLIGIAVAVNITRNTWDHTFLHDEARRTRLFALTALSVFFNLNQYPFANPLYFFFCVPLVIFSAIALAYFKGHRSTEHTPVIAWAVLSPSAMAILLFASFCVLRFGIDGVYGEYFKRLKERPLRYVSGISVPPQHADMYERIRFIADETLAEDQRILAGPDCPEVYFLTGRANQTPYMYDIFVTDPDYFYRVLDSAYNEQTGMVVINLRPEFSRPWPNELVSDIARRFTYVEQVGRFLIFAKPESSQSEGFGTVD